MDAATIGLILIAALVIHTDDGVRRAEKRIGRGVVHAVTLGKK